jgi:hypothetical protein
MMPFIAVSEGQGIKEELGEVGEGFELEGIACGVEEEHGGLLAGLAFEAGIGLDDEGYVGGADAVGQLLPLV